MKTISKKTKFLAPLAMSIALLAAGQSSNAANIICTEGPDAGQSLLTAFDCGIPPYISLGMPITQITGALSNGNDVDMYRIWITDGAAFTASTNIGQDTQLFLFNDQGIGIQGNDDGGNGFDARLFGTPNLTSSLPPGCYYLAISSFDNDPTGPNGGLIFETFPYQPQYPGGSGPTGTTGPLTNWTGAGGANGGANGYNYSIELTGAYQCVPEPGTALFGLGLVGSVLASRRRKRSAVI